jgi:hypothetical protein
VCTKDRWPRRRIIRGSGGKRAHLKHCRRARTGSPQPLAVAPARRSSGTKLHKVDRGRVKRPCWSPSQPSKPSRIQHHRSSTRSVSHPQKTKEQAQGNACPTGTGEPPGTLPTLLFVSTSIPTQYRGRTEMVGQEHQRRLSVIDSLIESIQ